MRLEKTIHRSGYFWFPSTPDRKLPGKVTLSDGGVIEFEVVGLSDETLHPFSFYSQQNPVRINGIVEHDGFVTLDRCRCKSCFGQDGGISKATFSVGMVVFGKAYHDDEDIMVDSFKFSVDLMDEWIGETGISFKTKRGKRLLNIFYDNVKGTSVELADGMSLEISCSWSLDGFPWISEISLRQKMFFELSCKGAVPLALLKSIARRITTFLIFATNKTVCINFAEGVCTGPLLKGKRKPKNRQTVVLFFDDMYHVPEVPAYDIDSVLFSFADIKDCFSDVISSWVSLYDDMEDILNLYFSIRVGGQRFLEGRFLSLVQVLEAYHSRVVQGNVMDNDEYEILINQIIDACPACHVDLIRSKLKYGNELGFGQKIIGLMSHFGDVFGKKKEIKRVAHNIVNARNYYTHHNSSLKSKVMAGDELVKVCSKLEVLLAMHIMQKINIPEKNVDSAKYIRMR